MKRFLKTKLFWITLILSVFIHFLLISYFNDLMEYSPDKIIMEKCHAVSISLKLKANLSPSVKSLENSNQPTVSDSPKIKNENMKQRILQMEEKIVKEELKNEKIIQDSRETRETTPTPEIKRVDIRKKVNDGFEQKSKPEKDVKEEVVQEPVEIKEKNHQKEKTQEEKPIPIKKAQKELVKEDDEILKEQIETDEPIENKEIKQETEKMLVEEKREPEKEIKQEKKQNLPEEMNHNVELKEIPVGEDFDKTFQGNEESKETFTEESEIEEILDFTGKSYSLDVNPPELLEFERPVYPENLREREIEGKVILKLLIDREGKVEDIQVFESSGYKAFDNIAVEAVRQWWFKPARKENRQKKCRVLIPINFQIK